MAATYAAPVTYGAPVTYAAPPAQAQQRIIPSDRRLLVGAIIGEMNVTREQLISQGRLIPDDNRAQQIVQQTSQMPGYVSSMGAIGMAIGNYTQFQQPGQPIVNGRPGGQSVQYGHQQPAAMPVQHGHQQVMQYGHAQPAKGAHPPDERLEISFLRAEGLHHLNFTGDNLWACCEIVKHSMFGKTHKCQTATISKNLNPEWNEMHHLDGYHQGDDLKFSVLDHGMIGSKTEGTVVMHSQDFYPNGFEGALKIQGLEHAFLEVRIVPLGAGPH
jgi:hypothetical protein